VRWGVPLFDDRCNESECHTAGRIEDTFYIFQEIETPEKRIKGGGGAINSCPGMSLHQPRLDFNYSFSI